MLRKTSSVPSFILFTPRQTQALTGQLTVTTSAAIRVPPTRREITSAHVAEGAPWPVLGLAVETDGLLLLPCRRALVGVRAVRRGGSRLRCVVSPKTGFTRVRLVVDTDSAPVRAARSGGVRVAANGKGHVHIREVLGGRGVWSPGWVVSRVQHLRSPHRRCRFMAFSVHSANERGTSLQLRCVGLCRLGFSSNARPMPVRGARGSVLRIHERLSCCMGVPVLLHSHWSVWHDEAPGEGAGSCIRLVIAGIGWETQEGRRCIAGPIYFVGAHDGSFLEPVTCGGY
jgi:hypothetical protein